MENILAISCVLLLSTWISVEFLFLKDLSGKKKKKRKKKKYPNYYPNTNFNQKLQLEGWLKDENEITLNTESWVNLSKFIKM